MAHLGVTHYNPGDVRDAAAASGNIYGPTVGDTSRKFQIGYNSNLLNNSNIGTKPKSIQQQLAELAASYQPSSSGNNNAYNLGMAELAYKKKSDASADATALEALNFGRAKDARVLGGMENYYNTGSYGTGFDKLLGMITDQGKVSERGISNAYDRAQTDIGQGYDAAKGLGDSGYNALNAYLQANPNNPYAGMEATVGSAPDALTQYLSAYGVSDQPVQGQIQADQLQAQQGAGNYQNLIDILSGVAQSGASSRGAESAMGQNLLNTSLGQERAGYQSAATNAQQQALNALQQQMFQSQFGVENDRNSLANQLRQNIIAAGGEDADTAAATAAAAAAAKKKADEEAAAAAEAAAGKGKTNQQIQLANLLRNVPGQDPNELLQMLNARRGY